MQLIEINIRKIIDICKRFHVRKLWVFGSILTNRFNDKSDVEIGRASCRDRVSINV